MSLLSCCNTGSRIQDLKTPQLHPHISKTNIIQKKKKKTPLITVLHLGSFFFYKYISFKNKFRISWPWRPHVLSCCWSWGHQQERHNKDCGILFPALVRCLERMQKFNLKWNYKIERWIDTDTRIFGSSTHLSTTNLRSALNRRQDNQVSDFRSFVLFWFIILLTCSCYFFLLIEICYSIKSSNNFL